MHSNNLGYLRNEEKPLQPSCENPLGRCLTGHPTEIGAMLHSDRKLVLSSPNVERDAHGVVSLVCRCMWSEVSHVR